MHRAAKKDSKETGGSGKGVGRDRRPTARWLPVALEQEFPDEFRHTGVFAAGLFVLILAVYVRTMHPSVSGGDNGELLGCACELGIAHPPGYPTFTMVGHLFFKFFPFGKPAFRIAFMSAACDALAGVLVMLSLQRWVLMHTWNARRDRRRLGKPDAAEGKAAAAKSSDTAGLHESAYIGSKWVGILGGGLYSLSPLVWLYSLQAEVFALNNMFNALLLYLIIRYNEQRSTALAYMGAFCIGLG